MYEDPVITNPKRRSPDAAGRDELFPYYAGFSGVFARELIRSAGLNRESTLMDPWNGSGTSTAAAALFGHRALGFDINPVMAVVAKARLLPRVELPSLAPLLADITKKAAGYRRICGDDDPLRTWFVPNSVTAIRGIERAIRKLLVSSIPSSSSFESVSQMSAIAAFFYVALFRTVRRLLENFNSSNPTWIKRPASLRSRMRPNGEDVQSVFRIQVANMSNALAAEPRDRDLITSNCSIQVASSESLPVGDHTVDLVLSSPPYCTRIDYVIATSPELAVLGFPMKDKLRELRGQLIGTPTIQRRSLSPDPKWGPTCNAFLERVVHHPSRAAKSYYYKTYVQYFAAIAQSFREISRCIKPGGKCVIVVQDSYFKDIRADLAAMFREIASEYHLSTIRQVHFPLTQTLASINTRSRRYRSSSLAVESVLCFTNN